jgi:hypothetical protein
VSSVRAEPYLVLCAKEEVLYVCLHASGDHQYLVDNSSQLWVCPTNHDDD